MNRLDRSVPFDSLPELLTPEEFRGYVGIGRSLCYDLLARGEIPSVRFGRVIRIPKQAVKGSRCAAASDSDRQALGA